jgi:NDP-sugar pyrophosphorylase family protein
VSIASATNRCLEQVDILVLAGGLGTRIRPVLGDLPKLLAPIGGCPYLGHLLIWLRRYGAQRVVLGLGHQAQAVLDYLRLQPAQDMELVTVVEPRPLGTAGAIRFARNELHSDPVLVMNGDSFTDANLCEFIAQHSAAREEGARATILCTEVSDAGRYGRVEVDEAGWICRFVEKDPIFSGSALINAGIYLLSTPLLDEIAVVEATSLERDIFEHQPPRCLAAFSGRFRFIDIGTPEALLHANLFFDDADPGLKETGA